MRMNHSSPISVVRKTDELPAEGSSFFIIDDLSPVDEPSLSDNEPSPEVDGLRSAPRDSILEYRRKTKDRTRTIMMRERADHLERNPARANRNVIREIT